MVEYDKIFLDTDHQIVRPKKRLLNGDTRDLKLVFVNRTGTALTGATAQFKLYNSAGSNTVTAAITPTISGARATLIRSLTVYAGGDFTAVGNWTATISLTFGSKTYTIKFPIEVVAVP